MDTKSETNLDPCIEVQVERVAQLEAEFQDSSGLNIPIKIELASAKKVLNQLLIQKFDELTKEHDLLEAQILIMQHSRMEICDKTLLAKHDELSAVKDELAQVELDRIEAAI